MSTRWTDTSRVPCVALTLYTTGDNCEHMTYDPRHGSSSFGLGPSEFWYGVYTRTSYPGWNTRYGFSLLLLPACLSARSIRFRRASLKAIRTFSRVFCANSSVSAVLPKLGTPRNVWTGSRGCRSNIKKNGVSCIETLQLEL